jgi:hypothetical protein
MAHAAAYVPIALSFLVLIVCLICHRSPVPIDRAEVEERGLRLLRSWLSPKQAQQWDALNEFEVVGSHTGTRYRIRRGKMMNVHEVDRAGNIVAHWCFAPQGDLPMGDVLLSQKIALETMERDALKMARRNHLHVADA